MDPNIEACTGNLIVTVYFKDNKVTNPNGVLAFGGTNLVVTPEAIQFTVDDKYGYAHVRDDDDDDRDRLQKTYVRDRTLESGYKSMGFFGSCERFSLILPMKRVQYFKYEEGVLSFWIAKSENTADCLSLTSRRIDCVLGLEEAVKASEWFTHLKLPYLKVMHHEDVIHFEFEGRDEQELLEYQNSVAMKYKDNLERVPIYQIIRYVVNEARADVLDGGTNETEKIRKFLMLVARHIPLFRNRMEELEETKRENKDEISVVSMFNRNVVNKDFVEPNSGQREGGSEVMDPSASTSNAGQKDCSASVGDSQSKPSDQTEQE